MLSFVNFISSFCSLSGDLGSELAGFGGKSDSFMVFIFTIDRNPWLVEPDVLISFYSRFDLIWPLVDSSGDIILRLYRLYLRW